MTTEPAFSLVTPQASSSDESSFHGEIYQLHEVMCDIIEEEGEDDIDLEDVNCSVPQPVESAQKTCSDNKRAGVTNTKGKATKLKTVAAHNNMRASSDSEAYSITVRSKDGPFHRAIPKLPMAVAVVCCIINVLIPGLGTLVTAFTVLCGAKTRIPSSIKALFLNLLVGILQLSTFAVIVGWVWSISWGMTFISISQETDEEFNAAFAADTPSFYLYARRQNRLRSKSEESRKSMTIH